MKSLNYAIIKIPKYIYGKRIKRYKQRGNVLSPSNLDYKATVDAEI